MSVSRRSCPYLGDHVRILETMCVSRRPCTYLGDHVCKETMCSSRRQFTSWYLLGPCVYRRQLTCLGDRGRYSWLGAAGVGGAERSRLQDQTGRQVAFGPSACLPAHTTRIPGRSWAGWKQRYSLYPVLMSTPYQPMYHPCLIPTDFTQPLLSFLLHVTI